MAMTTEAAVNAFVSVTTVHYGEVAYWWTEDKLHDNAYHVQVYDSMAVKLREVKAKYGVLQDIEYCCQWEGVQVFGEDRDKVAAAAAELARHLSRFKGVRSLGSV